jgi:hypothetical protein
MTRLWIALGENVGSWMEYVALTNGWRGVEPFSPVLDSSRWCIEMPLKRGTTPHAEKLAAYTGNKTAVRSCNALAILLNPCNGTMITKTGTKPASKLQAALAWPREP